eukprot:COSAG04_NODE_7213_length_1166_cov_1.644799_1_plen_250_part_01
MGCAFSKAIAVEQTAPPVREEVGALVVEGQTAPWLRVEADVVEVGAANGMLRKVPQTVNLISIFGAARGGKSTMMSLLSGQPGLFAASPGGESYTQGIMMANHFAGLGHFSAQDGGRRVEAEEQGLTVGFLDAEGQGDRGIEHDLKLISAPMLLSKVQIFNWNSSMQKDKILDELMVMTKVALKYREKSSTTKPFCYLAITFQNCREQEISDGEPHRLAQLLDPEPLDDLEDDKAKARRNETRRFLRGSF